MDKRFVFALRHNSAPVPLDPTSLFIPGFPDCNPFFVDATVAIFMFGVEECGTHAYVSLLCLTCILHLLLCY